MRRPKVIRKGMLSPNLLTLQLNPNFIKRRKPSLLTLANAHPVMNLLSNQRRIHAVRDLVDGDVASVEGLAPEELCVDGDVVDVLEAVVWEVLHGDALAGACFDVEFVGGLGVRFVGL